MTYTIVFIQCFVFIVSYVYCARKPPANFFNDDWRKESDCIKLNHVFSHVSHRDERGMSLDMICKTRHDEYDLVSFASSDPAITFARNPTINISKASHDVTIINFGGPRLEGKATLFFESVEDAKKFNKDVYPPLKRHLKLLQRITGTIDKILPTQPTKYPTATRYANIYTEEKTSGRRAKKFVIEVDGIEEPALVFIDKEFDITVDEDQSENDSITEAQLKLGGGATYEFYFETADEGSKFMAVFSPYADVIKKRSQ